MDEGKTAPKPPDSEPATADPGHTLEVQQQFLLHQPALMAYALSLVPCRQDAQDLVQETFLIVSRKADCWAEGSSFMAWAGKILRYEALHQLRALRRRPMSLEEDLLEQLHGNEPPDDDLLHQIQRLKRCIQKLSPRARQLVMLRYHSGMLPEAIAKSLQWTANSVRVTLTRAKDSLRDCMAKREGGRDKK